MRLYKGLSRTKFEDIVLTYYQNVLRRPYKEETFEFKIVNLTLYYVNGVHIGTWRKSRAWLEVSQ